MYLTDLAYAARKSGLNVVEVPGWKTRGHGGMKGVRSVMVHHTATSNSAKGIYPTLRVVRDGHGGLKGPLSQLGLGRDGTVFVIAAGRCYHAGPTANPGVQGNSYSIGIEAEHSGYGPWTSKQYVAYIKLVAALNAHYGLTTSRVWGHKEAAVPEGRKTDPNFNMKTFRTDVGGKRFVYKVPPVPAGKAPAPKKAVTSTLSAKVLSNAAKLQNRIKGEPRGPFPLPHGHWYGPNDKSSRSHSGYQSKDRMAIKMIQRKVGVTADGQYGPNTKRAVAAYQSKLGLPKSEVDGLVGPTTWGLM